MTREHVNPASFAYPLSRRRLLASLIAVPLVAAVAAACGDDDVVTEPRDTSPGSPTTSPTTPATQPPTTEPGFAHPTGANEVVVRIDSGIGAFTTPQWSFGALPSLLVTGDGTVYTPGATTAIYPGQLLPAVAVETIDAAAIQQVLAAADEFGLLAAAPDYSQGQPPVTDVGSTIVTINVNGATYRHEAYALGMEQDGGTAPTKARADLQAFVTKVSDLRKLVGEANVKPKGMTELVKEFAVAAMPADMAQYTEEPKPTVQPWPTDAGFELASVSAGKGCHVLPGDKVMALFKDANQLSFYTEGAVTYQILVRAQLPGSPTC